MTLCAYRVDCAEVLDLTDEATRAAYGVIEAALACAWADLVDREEPAPNWEVADRLRADGVAAVVVPSFAPGAQGGRDVNLVF